MEIYDNNEKDCDKDFSHLRLDSTLLTVGTIIDAIALCDNCYQAKTKTGRDYVGFNLKDLHGLSVNATLFEISQKENITKTLRMATGKIVYLKGEVVSVRENLCVNIITIDTVDNCPFTREDFYPTASNLEVEVEAFKELFNMLAGYEYTKPVMEVVSKLRFLTVLHDSSLGKSQMPIKGEGLVICNRVMSKLIELDTNTPEGLNVGKIGAAMTMLLLGTSLYIRDKESNGSALVSTKFSQESLLVNNIILKFKAFGENKFTADLITEFTHLRECYVGVSSPSTYLAHVIPLLIKTECEVFTLSRFMGTTHVGNEYILDNKKICRCL